MVMKRLFPFLLLPLLSACYEDLGNYDYRFEQMNRIDSLVFTPGTVETLNGSTIEFTQPLTVADTLKRVSVAFKQSHFQDMEQLDFRWMRSYKNAKGVTLKDTLTTRGYMDVVLPLGQASTYNVLLQIYDRSTDLSHYARFNVATRPIFKNSVFVLHGTEGNVALGNIEQIGADTHVRTDAYKLIYPQASNPFAQAYKLMYHTTFTFRNYTQPYETNNLIVFAPGTQTQVFHPFGLKPKHTGWKNYVLPSAGSGPINVDRVGMVGDPSNQSDYYYAIGRDGRFVTARALPSFKFPATSSSLGAYKVTAAAITYGEFVFWDDRAQRFLRVNKEDAYGIWGEEAAYQAQLNYPLLDAHVDFSTLSSELSIQGKTAVYGFTQFRENFEAEHPYFVFRDKESGQYSLYELTPLSTGGKDDKSRARQLQDKDDAGKGGGDDGKGKDSDDGSPAYSIAGQTLPDFTPTSPSSISYNAWFPTNYLFYVEGGNLVRYNVSNADKTILYTAPVGYTISCYKPRSESSFVYAADLGLHIDLGLVKDGEGAVASIKLTTSGDLDERYAATFHNRDNEGKVFGPIRDLQFVHEYSYKFPTYGQ